METRDAIDRAREAGLDLVEVSPNSTPPVCRIMDYGKWKYAQSKKERKSKAHRHETELKEIRIKTPKIGDHDLEIKVNHAREFLERGDRVQFSLRFRGRELAHIDEGVKVFGKVKVLLGDLVKVEQDCRREGRRISMLLAPSGKPVEKKAPKPKKADKPTEKPADAPAAQDAAPAPEAPIAPVAPEAPAPAPAADTE